jgi:hypothetical protein
MQGGYMGRQQEDANAAARDKAKAELQKLEGIGKTSLDKRYQEEQAPIIERALQESQQRAEAQQQAYDQQQAAQQAALQAKQEEQARIAAMRTQMGDLAKMRQQQTYGQMYNLLSENMPPPAGIYQSPTSQESQTTMIDASGGQNGILGAQQPQMSPGQIAAMQGQFREAQDMYGQQNMYPSMYQQQPFQQQPFQLTPQQIEAQRGIGVQEQSQAAALQAQQMQQMQQAPQVQQAPVMAAYGGIMKGYK